MLVSYDLLGLFDQFVPPFVKQYAQLGAEIVQAARTYADQVRQGDYPEARAVAQESVPASACLEKLSVT